MSGKTSMEPNIHEIFSKNTFVKIKPAFNIGMIIFSFVEKDANNVCQKSIDCFMRVADVALLAKKINEYRLYQAIDAEKKKGAQYPAAVWLSPLGGVPEKKAKERNLRTDGKAVSRHFKIAPGSRKYAVITAVEQAGDSDENGIIVPDKNDRNAKYIRVGVGSYDELMKMALMCEAAVTIYLQERLNGSTQTENEWKPDSNENPFVEEDKTPSLFANNSSKEVKSKVPAPAVEENPISTAANEDDVWAYTQSMAWDALPN